MVTSGLRICRDLRLASALGGSLTPYEGGTKVRRWSGHSSVYCWDRGKSAQSRLVLTRCTATLVSILHFLRSRTLTVPVFASILCLIITSVMWHCWWPFTSRLYHVACFSQFSLMNCLSLFIIVLSLCFAAVCTLHHQYVYLHLCVCTVIRKHLISILE